MDIEIWRTLGDDTCLLSSKIENHKSLGKIGPGDEARTRNFQLGKLNFRSFIFSTYKTAQKTSTCIHCIPCMRCLICVSLPDVCGTVCHNSLPAHDSLQLLLKTHSAGQLACDRNEALFSF